jgi:hypothetical protein
VARLSSRQREEVMIRIVTSITLASGGPAAAYAAMGVAAADPDATTISVPDPFGVSFVGNPDLTYQTGDASENIAYGYQTIDFDSSNFSSVFHQQRDSGWPTAQPEYQSAHR